MKLSKRWLVWALAAVGVVALAIVVWFTLLKDNHTVGDTWTRPTDDMVMVYVPGGEFEMGNEDGDYDEKPVHTVTLDSFWMDRTLVTNAQYARCAAAGECQEAAYLDDEMVIPDEFPVVGVEWREARNYCAWVGGRLPTEAEWEYAARGRTGLLYPWGNEFACEKGNFPGDVCDEYILASPVESYPEGASWCGVLDMAGNVWEWVADWYADEYYADPTASGSNPTGPESGKERTMRGGSWADVDGMKLARSSNRSYLHPSSEANFVGFRCVVSPEQVQKTK